MTIQEDRLAKLGQITEAAIEYADMCEEEEIIQQWNKNHPLAQRSNSKARYVASTRLQDIKRYVRELHQL